MTVNPYRYFYGKGLQTEMGPFVHQYFSHWTEFNRNHTLNMANAADDTELVTEVEETELISFDPDLNSKESEDPLFELDSDDFDSDLETKFFEPHPESMFLSLNLM